MKGRGQPRRFIIVAGGVFLIGIGLLAYWWMAPFLAPVSIELPPEATSVRCKVTDPPGPGYAEWIKFSVPPEKALSTAKSMLLKHGERFNKNPQENLKATQVTAGSIQAKDHRYSPGWFDPERIEQGSALYLDGISQPFLPQLCVDEKRGIVYYTSSD